MAAWYVFPITLQLFENMLIAMCLHHRWDTSVQVVVVVLLILLWRWLK